MNKTLRALILTIMVGCFQPAQGVGWLWVAVKWGTPIIIGLLGKWYNQGNRIEQKVNKIDNDVKDLDKKVVDGFNETNNNVKEAREEIKKVNDNIILLDQKVIKSVEDIKKEIKESEQNLKKKIENNHKEEIKRFNELSEDLKKLMAFLAFKYICDNAHQEKVIGGIKQVTQGIKQIDTKMNNQNILLNNIYNNTNKIHANTIVSSNINQQNSLLIKNKN